MKKIYIDLSSTQPYGNIKINGGGQYAEIIFRILCEKTDASRIIALLDNRKGENIMVDSTIENHNITVIKFNSENEFISILNNIRNSIIFIPVCYPKYYRARCEKSNLVITTIHDLSSVYVDMCNHIVEQEIGVSKKDRIKEKYFRSVLAKKHIREHKGITKISESQVIITDSIYSRNQLLKYTKTQKAIYVLYPAFQQKSEEIKFENKKELLNNKDNFVLFVSASRWHKNNYFALKVIDNEISNQNISFVKRKYVVIGVDSLHKTFYLNNLKNLEYFIFLDYVSQSEYNWYMMNAEVFIYPSLFEGFGVPPVQAMRYGTIPICSSATCIPEICGEAALYFDPYNVEDFKATFETFEDKKQILLQKGKERFRYIEKRQFEDTEYLLNLLLG